ncbi:unnamed protein product [Rotaria sp. Silwood2]|nr:unnamed protein product [Rotaria sp. Silwood2]CAF3080084.1 unnamed protein product [Rotaria sp. Silwood2]CAF3335769.1 unnamed protein product [Rotaria sp. Silwood2]CAF3380342.1 unnamed protein product [Rotaria sp. Silwood2]CAF4304394.1 unnamed protein product [Rotaria sp. Silwood2]
MEHIGNMEEIHSIHFHHIGSMGLHFKIDNYIKFKYDIMHSTNSSQDEDYWYANETCQTDSGNIYRCEEIYLKKNTQISL